MKRLMLLFGLLSSISMVSQENLEDLLASGIQDAQRFATSYISPATEAMIYNNANGWIQSAEVKSPLKFEISIIGNATFVKDKNTHFYIFLFYLGKIPHFQFGCLKNPDSTL